MNARPHSESAVPLRLLLLVLLAMLLAGCGLMRPTADEPTRAKLAELRYPDGSAYGPDLDIRVLQEGTTIRAVNRTAMAYEDMQLWLDRQYVRPIDRLEIGEENRYELGRFVNRFGEHYPTAELLAPDKGQEVVLAELYDPKAQVRYRLTRQPPVQRNLLELAADALPSPGE